MSEKTKFREQCHRLPGRGRVFTYNDADYCFAKEPKPEPEGEEVEPED